MSKVVGFTVEDFYPGGSLYPNPKEANLFLSLGHQAGFYYPLPKRSRVSVPFDFSGEWFVQKPKTTIESLPDECLFEILRRLPVGQDRSQCASVSKRWLMLLSSISKKEICINEKDGGDEGHGDEGYLSRTLEGKKATDVRLAAISVNTASSGGLGKLSIRGNNKSECGVTDLGLKAIGCGCPSLKSFSLWNVASVGDAGLIEIAAGCQQLRRLDLINCPAISDKSLVAVAMKCPNLLNLSIELCPNIGNEGLQAIGKLCPNLRSVSIKDCTGVGDQGITGLLTSTSHVLTKVELVSLTVSDLSLAVIGHYGISVNDLVLNCLPNVTERGFWTMSNGRALQKLKSLTIGSCRGVTDVGLEAIGKGCPNIKYFQLRKCPFLSDNGLVSFAKAAPSLENLQLEECHRVTQFGFFALLFTCGAKLKVLTLVSCYGIKDMNVKLPEVFPCVSLSSLSIRHCPGFGNATLAVLGKLCPQLQNVELNGLEGITDAGFLPLLESSKAGLVKVNLRGCVNLTDKVVSSIANLHWSSLDVLNLDGCKEIGDASLKVIASNCQVLSDLDVSRCAITDTGIAALAQGNLHSLKILSLARLQLSSFWNISGPVISSRKKECFFRHKCCPVVFLDPLCVSWSSSIQYPVRFFPEYTVISFLQVFLSLEICCFFGIQLLDSIF
ncbi:putative F-box domain, leucine-rich repeat domain, L domain-containing protein [Lupinus albus]|uniref:Putative F-box domain, leucine-rich repeat domain, L domain-containing protein n=1 Tax=Lupinus albus TaxID=3870 RepID=A0A6A4Q5U6_LUPAL|nr:putative F-box domain, leucine-rich repeat domain, L domain-containing protein [Lupinus albus]